MADLKKAIEKAGQVLTANSVVSPPVLVSQILPNYGLKIFTADLSSFPDVCGYINVGQQAVYVNQNDPQPRQAFTLAHELGHQILHHEKLQINPDISILSRRPIAGETDDIEQEANAFAAALLVPKPFLERIIGIQNPTVADFAPLPVQTLADYFGVTLEVIGYRLNLLQIG